VLDGQLRLSQINERERRLEYHSKSRINQDTQFQSHVELSSKSSLRACARTATTLHPIRNSFPKIYVRTSTIVCYRRCCRTRYIKTAYNFTTFDALRSTARLNVFKGQTGAGGNRTARAIESKTPPPPPPRNLKKIVFATICPQQVRISPQICRLYCA
jgi:hypothetical protein